MLNNMLDDRRITPPFFKKDPASYEHYNRMSALTMSVITMSVITMSVITRLQCS